KTGAARMALEAQAPIIPLIVWGAQRAWTKDHPKSLGRNKLPITVVVGVPIPATGTMEQLDATLRESMTALLHKTQLDYPHPEGAYWVPRRLGGRASGPSVKREVTGDPRPDRHRCGRHAARRRREDHGPHPGRRTGGGRGRYAVRTRHRPPAALGAAGRRRAGFR